MKCTAPENAAIELEKLAQYWERSFAERRTQMVESISQPWAKLMGMHYADYLLGKHGAHRASLHLKKQSYIFRDFIESFESAEKIVAESLIEKFTTSELRKMELLMSFLAKTGINIPSQQQLRESSEQRRIKVMLAEAANSRLGPLLQSYHDVLQARPSDPGSKRLALRAAVSFATMAKDRVPDQGQLTRYLRRKPGQRASLVGFVNYLRAHGYSLHLKKRRRRTRLRAVAKPVDMQREMENMGALSTSLSELRASAAGLLVSSLGVPLERVVELPRDAVVVDANELLLTIGVQGPLVGSVRVAMERYLHSRDAKYGPAGHLFPGRVAGRPVTPESVSYQLKKRDVSLGVLAVQARASIQKLAAATSPD